MNMDFMDLYFNIIGLAAGIYCLYTWFKLKKEGKLFANQLLVPRDAKPSDCLDEEGYIRTVSPCLLMVGLVWALTGGAGLADSQWHFLTEQGSFYLNLGGVGLCLVAFIIYLIVWLRARKNYWVV